MSDTLRTRAALQALLADNLTGAIDAQDLRDLLASVPTQSGTANVMLQMSGTNLAYYSGTNLVLLATL